MKTTNSIPEIKWDDLHTGRSVLPAPFQVTLTDSDEPFLCDEIVRLVPGKRLVAFGNWGDKTVVAKIFYEHGNAKRHAKREIAGIERLVASNTPTPKLLWKGSAQKQKIQVLLFERINDAINLDFLSHNKCSSDALIPIMQEITLELATQHVLGIVQNDLHLKNFLVTEKKVYTLDGSSITQHDILLPKEQSLDHLGLFFSQLGVDSEPLQEILFQTYIKARGWIVNKADLELLRKATKKWTRKRWLRYEKKIQRSSTAFARATTSKSLIMYDRSYLSGEFENLLINPEGVFQQYETEILKAGRSSTVAKIKIDNRYFVIKRYNLKNKWHAFRRCLRGTRAASSWVLSQRLCLMNVPTAKPVAFIENRFLGLRGKSYFIMEFVKGPHAGEYFSNSNSNQIETTANSIVTLISNLAKLRLTHGDLKMTNILIENDKPVIIDLDGMIEHRNPLGLKIAFKKELQRFMKNWENQPEIYNLFAELISKLY